MDMGDPCFETRVVGFIGGGRQPGVVEFPAAGMGHLTPVARRFTVTAARRSRTFKEIRCCV